MKHSRKLTRLGALGTLLALIVICAFTRGGPANALQQRSAQDQAGGRVPGVTVRFDVTGPVSATGLATTDARGQAEFCYPGALRPGPVAVRAQGRCRAGP